LKVPPKGRHTLVRRLQRDAAVARHARSLISVDPDTDSWPTFAEDLELGHRLSTGDVGRGIGRSDLRARHREDHHAVKRSIQ